jgi:membrane-bound metal-dependent hydrolase YbcI (DUF457 family)
VGNYHQHVGFATSFGIVYAVGTYMLAGLHWLYGSIAALLAILGGLLPDIDSATVSGTLGILAALEAVHLIKGGSREVSFEMTLWVMLLSYSLVRRGMRSLAKYLMVHRGISHSVPTLAVWMSAIYLYYPSQLHVIRVMMAVAVGLGFFSHLLLDEMFSVDISNARVNRAFGTAMKFWAPSLTSTVGIYALLSLLLWRVLEVWPEGPILASLNQQVPPPKMPYVEEIWKQASAVVSARANSLGYR